jgi:hypothetical protein
VQEFNSMIVCKIHSPEYESVLCIVTSPSLVQDQELLPNYENTILMVVDHVVL